MELTLDHPVQLYTTPWCPYCIRAKKLLKQKGIDFKDIDVSFAPEVRATLLKVTGSRTVPQIFINGQSIGGCDDLFALEMQGRLDDMLQMKA